MGDILLQILEKAQHLNLQHNHIFLIIPFVIYSSNPVFNTFLPEAIKMDSYVRRDLRQAGARSPASNI